MELLILNPRKTHCFRHCLKFLKVMKKNLMCMKIFHFIKYYFYYGKKVMTYTIIKKHLSISHKRYLNIVKGYEDCGLDKSILLKV